MTSTIIGIASLPVGIVSGIYFGLAVYRKELPLMFIAVFCGIGMWTGVMRTMIDIATWLR